MSDQRPDGDAIIPASGADGPSTWERWWTAFDRWGGTWLLGFSTLLSVPRPDLPARERAVTLVLVALAAIWLVVPETRAPDRWKIRDSYQAVHLAGLLVLATALMLRHVTFFVFAITGFLYAARLRSKTLVYLAVAATSLLINLITWGGFPRPTAEETGGFLALFVIQTGVIGSGIIGGRMLADRSEERGRTVERLEVTLAENERLHAQLVLQARDAGVHDERERLAREIHDTLAQGFTGIITQLEAAGQSKSDPVALQRHLDVAADLARRSLDEARRSVHALGPGALERGRLADALGELADDWSQRAGVAIRLDTEDHRPALAAPVEVALLRVAQEALANVTKHAAAERVAITLSSLDDRVVLDVRDDGRGFDPHVAATTNGSFGLTSMRQRVAALGGTLAVESAPGAGTAISATIPHQDHEDADV